MKNKFKGTLFLLTIYLLLIGTLFSPLRVNASSDEILVEEMNATLSTTMDGSGVAWNGTHFLIFGGVHTGYTAVTDIHAYDPYEDEMTLLNTTLPAKRYNPGVVATDTCAYIFAGTSNIVYYKSIFKYIFETDTCVNLPVSLTYPREIPHAVSNGTHAFIFGGFYSGQIATVIEVFDFATENVSQMNTVLPGAPAGVTFNGSHFLLYGMFNTSQYISTHIFAYDPVLDNGLVELPLQLPYELTTPSTVQIDNIVLLFAGRNTTHIYNDYIIVFDQKRDEIFLSEQTTLHKGGYQRGVGSIDNCAYTFGGTIPPLWPPGRVDSVTKITPPLWRLDQTPPNITAELVPIEIYSSNEGLFEVQFNASDDYDPNPNITAVIDVPLPDNLSDWTIHLTTDTSFTLKIDYAAKKLEIKDLDPESRLNEIQQYSGIIMENGQRIKVKLKDVEKFMCKDEKGTLKFEAPEIILRVTASDEAGNINTIFVYPDFNPS
ncbi:MAG: hypothetical protein ACFFDC_15855 [Promethearchaeota archaeon]